MSLMETLFQNANSPIKQRTTLRALAFISGIGAIVLCSSPYIGGFIAKRDDVMAKQAAQTQTQTALEEQKRDAEVENKGFEIDLQKKRDRANQLRKVGIVFVDPSIESGTSVYLQGTGKPMPNGTTIEDINGTRAIVFNGKAKIIKGKKS